MKKVILMMMVIGVAMAAVWMNRDALLEKGLEAGANSSLAPFFAGTLDLENVHLDSSLKLNIQRLTGAWQTPDGSFPFEMNQIVLEEPVTVFMFQHPAKINFEQLRPAGSLHEGIRGSVRLNQTARGTTEVKADFAGVYLEELLALDPENLKGASGRLIGDLDFKVDNRGDQTFQLDLKVAEPGGRLQARFFDLLLPYLPPADQKALVVIKDAKMVQYKEAEITAGMEGPETIKLLLRIRVPDYNLNLNLNLKVRVESRESFVELARIAGLVQVKSS